MKVYIVERRDCDDVFFEGVFSTQGKAHKYCVKEFGEDYEKFTPNYEVVIGEATVDEKA